MRRFLPIIWGLACCLVMSASAAPLPVAAVPEPLKAWVPWVMHGHETQTCPLAHDGSGDRVCVWPSGLNLEVTRTGATFRMEVQVFGAAARVALPGESGRWPQDVKANGRVKAVVADEGRPTLMLDEGQHQITGTLRWIEAPQDLQLPVHTGTLTVSIGGRSVQRVPDTDGRIFLQQQVPSEPSSDALTVRTSRLIDDDIPMRITTHYHIAFSGKPREIELPAALLAGFIAEEIESSLPARLQDNGALRVQGRPGNWVLEVRSRSMAPTLALTLPQTASEEVWSFVAHPDLRTVTLTGLTSVDPKQLLLPEAWRVHPAYLVQPGQALKWVESRRGNPKPAADKLALLRDLWLDFEGEGYTLRDVITGQLSRSWRLEVQAPVQLGRASDHARDQPITRRDGAAGDGVELRDGSLQLQADSRIAGAVRVLPASAWSLDFDAAMTRLHLPPGWLLLHASGVDQAQGSWLDRWTLWDLFVVVLCSLGAAKLLGRGPAVVWVLAMVLSWHMGQGPRLLWLVLLGLMALTRVLPAGKLWGLSWSGAWACVVLLACVLVPYSMEQIRWSIYPSLEQPAAWTSPQASPLPDLEQREVERARPAAAPARSERHAQLNKLSSAYTSADSPEKSLDSYAARADTLQRIDPHAQVQTGPGVPTWIWHQHRLIWQGPVLQSQTVQLYLLPPVAMRLLRLAALALTLCALVLLVLKLPRRPPVRHAGTGAGASMAPVATVLLGLALGWFGLPQEAQARSLPLPSQPVASAPAFDILNELRPKLTAAPDCLPQCAHIARAYVQAQGSKIQLRLEVHALADVTVPLPGQGAHWRPQVQVDGKAGAVRRDENGALWVAVRAGVSQVVLTADVGEVSSVEIALPMPVQEVTPQVEGWTLEGLNAENLATGALSLARVAGAGRAYTAEGGTQRDALPPFVQIERILHLGMSWTLETRVTRLSSSRAPVRAKVRLLPGESVNDAAVHVEDGVAIVQLGAEESASFVSTLKEQPQLQLQSGRETQQIEVWTLDPGPQWRFNWAGIAPIQYESDARLRPQWRPWPGESLSIEVSKPAGVAGQTLTLDKTDLHFRPGLRATDVTATAQLRSSQGGNHRVQLPADAEFLGVRLNGKTLPVQAQGGHLELPITPGAHALQIDWREPRGMGWHYATTPFGWGAAGVNASTSVQVATDRVVLALAGPSVGPAVLFWGLVFTLGLAAWALARTGLTPLGVSSWFLLGLGLAQASVLGAAVVAGWFFALAARKRWAALGAQATDRRWAFNAKQVLLVLWTLAASLALLNAVHVGLLGYPDLMIEGNGSSAALLRWYQDRYTDSAQTAWVISVPLLAYRIVMLAWALWLAVSVLKWLKWAWLCFSEAAYWRRAAVAIDAEPAASVRSS